MNFSIYNLQQLTRLADDLGATLIKAGFGFYTDYLSSIRLAAEKQDAETFKKLVVSNELFGGSGAIWEIWIEDKQLRTLFERQFCDLIDFLKKMGIKNTRIDQVRSGFKLRSNS